MTSSARDTPMMRHFLEIKAQHPDAIVLYRMGDFYELFLADAETAAPLLDLTLTSRDKGKPDAVPMCGFPVHSADGYVKRLA
jgi:DNA mismatch repair protein MutS